MDQRNVLLVMSDACGWRELRGKAIAHPWARDVVATESAREALRLIESNAFDAIILAGRLGGLGSASGLSAVDFIWQLRQKVSAQTRIALIANEFTAADFSALARLNLAAHLLWSDLSSETHAELLYALLHPRIRVFSEAISRAYLAQERADRAKPALPANVTDTERAMLNGLAASLSHEQIGMVAAISVRTAERCISDLKQKFGVESPFTLGCEASRYGLIDETVWREFAKEMA